VSHLLRRSAFLPLLAVGACATIPDGPAVLVLPGNAKTFDQFRADDFACRNYAAAQIGGGTAQQAAFDSGAATAAVGTVVGAAAGAAMGGSQGAATGAGAGLVVGSAAGSSMAYASGYNLQQRYDNAYMQCMYASGHKIPVAGTFDAPAEQQPAPLASESPPPAQR
jgi:hypothetical protein